MVTVARLLNLTLVVPELDKTSFWADPRYNHRSKWNCDLTNSFNCCFRISTVSVLFAVILRISLM